MYGNESFQKQLPRGPQITNEINSGDDGQNRQLKQTFSTLQKVPDAYLLYMLFPNRPKARIQILNKSKMRG